MGLVVGHREPGFEDYRLIDSGGGRKLERFGRVTVDRPEPQAMWQPARSPDAWAKADATSTARTMPKAASGARTPRAGELAHPSQGRELVCRLTSFRHLGIFPEQLPHWEWMLQGLGRMRASVPASSTCSPIPARRRCGGTAGAEVTHVDASKRAIAWGKQNQRPRSLGEAPIRWMLDDARKFVAREVRRGKTYNVILVDPPKFGRGPDNEVWDLFEHLPALLRDCACCLRPKRTHAHSHGLRHPRVGPGDRRSDARVRWRGAAGLFERRAGDPRGRWARVMPTSLFTRWSSDDSG